MNNDNIRYLIGLIRTEFDIFQKRIDVILSTIAKENENLASFKRGVLKDKIQTVIMKNDDITLASLIQKTRFIKNPKVRHLLLKELLDEKRIHTKIRSGSRIYWSNKSPRPR